MPIFVPQESRPAARPIRLRTHKVVTASGPGDEPVTLQELRGQLNVVPFLAGGTHPDDTLITRLGSAARAACETHCERAFALQTWAAGFPTWLDAFSGPLAYAPIDAILDVKYTDVAGEQQTLSADNYLLSPFYSPQFLQPGLIDFPYPALHPKAELPVVVTFTLGAAAPEEVKAAILLHAADLYLHREDTIQAARQELGLRVKALLAPHRCGLGV